MARFRWNEKAQTCYGQETIFGVGYGAWRKVGPEWCGQRVGAYVPTRTLMLIPGKDGETPGGVIIDKDAPAPKKPCGCGGGTSTKAPCQCGAWKRLLFVAVVGALAFGGVIALVSLAGGGKK